MKVLVPVDLSEITNAAVRTAKRICETHGGEVILFHAVSPAVYIPHPEGADVLDVRVLQEIEEGKKGDALRRLEDLVELLSPVSSKVVVEVGDPRDLILEVEERERPDLIVIGSHRKGLVERILIGSTTEKVVKHSSSPVIVIKGFEPTFSKRVLVAYDFSQTAEKALDFALKLLKPFSLTFEVLHVEEPINIPLTKKLGRAVDERYKEEKRRYLEEVKRRIEREGARVEIKVKEGKKPAEGIVKRVEEDGDLEMVVMGNVGLSERRRTLLGETSREVFRRVDLPILIYKEGRS